MEDNSKMKDTVSGMLEKCRKSGADDARITYSRSTSTTVSTLNDRIDSIQQSTESLFTLQLFADGRSGSFSTNRISDLEDLISRGMEITRLLAEDRYSRLPDSGLYYRDNGEAPDLEQYDSSFDSIGIERKKEMILESAAETAGKDSRMTYMSAEYNDCCSYMYMADTGGFAGEQLQTVFSASCECSVMEDDGSRPEGWWSESSMYLNDLKIEGCSSRSLERALSRLGARKVDSGRYNAVVEYRTVSKLFSYLIGAITGSQIQQKKSFLDGCLGKKIFSDILTVEDLPFTKRSPGARLFDDEGIACRERKIFDGGYVNLYYLNTYYAGKLGMEPTSDSPSVIRFSESVSGKGACSAADMMKAAGKGIFITGFNGGNCNPTTGDFSFGIEGFLFRNGVIVHPVKEMNLTGNMKDLWSRIMYIGKDYNANSSWQLPSITFEDLDFNGI